MEKVHLKASYYLADDCECDKESETFKFNGCICHDHFDATPRFEFFTFERREHGVPADHIRSLLAVSHNVEPKEILIQNIRHLDHKWLNVYKIDRAFGGHEEGGWYYDYGVPVVSIPLIPSILKHKGEIWADLKQQYSNEGRRPISSVLSDGEYVIKEEYEQGRAWPTETPHYE